MNISACAIMIYELLISSRYIKSKKRNRFISVISVISILGVAVGVTTMCVVLSVMSGFEDDLKTKILGAKAHILITRDDQKFDKNYYSIADRIKKLEGVKGAMVFYQSEAMLTRYGERTGVVVKGIDPQAAKDVLNLVKDI